jgi:hypothetical protein
MGLSVLSTIIVYFFIPETKQLPVEEIAALFGDQVVAHLSKDGHAIVEDDASSTEKGAGIQEIAMA